MIMSRFFCTAFLSCFFLVLAQEPTIQPLGSQPTSESITIRYLTERLDGKKLNSSVIPVAFAIETPFDSKNININFNCTSFLEEDRSVIPDVLGFVFKGQNESMLQVKVYKGLEKPEVTLHRGPYKQLETEGLTLNLRYNEIGAGIPNHWNGTIFIPLEYFPRETNQISAYANYSQTFDHNPIVITLQSPTKQEATPNMLKPEFFREIKINANFTEWPQLWQKFLLVTPGGSPQIETNSTSKTDAHAIKQEPENKKNEGSILEQGLVTWILVSAVFCGILHIFVLAL